jgi:glutamine amidotransferase/cyclase
MQVADAYFRAGADKVSLGSDAVDAARAYLDRGGKGDGTSSIETISAKYGAQVQP